MVGTALVGLRILVSGAPGFRKPKREEAGAEDKNTSGSRFVPSLRPNLWIKNQGGGEVAEGGDGEEFRCKPESLVLEKQSVGGGMGGQCRWPPLASSSQL